MGVVEDIAMVSDMNKHPAQDLNSALPRGTFVVIYADFSDPQTEFRLKLMIVHSCRDISALTWLT